MGKVLNIQIEIDTNKVVKVNENINDEDREVSIDFIFLNLFSFIVIRN